MLLHVTDEKYAEDFADIYNSANTLFEESERGNATPEIFLLQIKAEENFLEVSDSGEALAFMSYRRRGACFELSSLYVRREHQKEGLGRRLLQYFEDRVPDGGVIFVKVLKNAPWAEGFYRRNGYVPPDRKIRDIAVSQKIVEKPWSMVLYKELRRVHTIRQGNCPPFGRA